MNIGIFNREFKIINKTNIVTADGEHCIFNRQIKNYLELNLNFLAL